MADHANRTAAPEPAPPWNPYLAGVLLGATLLLSFAVLGAGLGGSAGLARAGAWLSGCCASAHTLASEYFGKWGPSPLRYYLTFMLVGTFFGGLFSALLAHRFRWTLEKGARCSDGGRIAGAVIGGVLVGFASRLANGCTSGQALTGAAMLAFGSLLYMMAVFAGGYAAAPFVRGEWRD